MLQTTLNSLGNPLSTNLAGKIFQFYKKLPLGNSKQPDQLKKPEYDGLQYLSGYVVHKLMRKARNNPQYKSTCNLKIISALEKTLVNNEELQAQTLISVQTRGGLTAVNTNCQNIFHEAEKNFRIETSQETHLSKIDIPFMTTVLLKDPSVTSYFKSIVGEYDEDREFF